MRKINWDATEEDNTAEMIENVLGGLEEVQGDVRHVMSVIYDLTAQGHAPTADTLEVMGDYLASADTVIRAMREDMGGRLDALRDGSEDDAPKRDAVPERPKCPLTGLWCDGRQCPHADQAWVGANLVHDHRGTHVVGDVYSWYCGHPDAFEDVSGPVDTATMPAKNAI